MYRNLLFIIVSLIILTACEEVIPVDLNSAEPAFVVEATIYTDSVCQVHLTRTNNYFSQEEPGIIENARVFISDQTSTEELSYTANGIYKGDTIKGTENTQYEIEIIYEGRNYRAESVMPESMEITAVYFYKSIEKNIFNPNGETIFTVSCEFEDNPHTENFYMVQLEFEDSNSEKRYFLFTEQKFNGGSLVYDKSGKTIFMESVFYKGGSVNVKLYSLDKKTYKHFLQLDDILFWKRRLMPPTPYNPDSNLTNGALGYFAAWGYDSMVILLQ